MNNNKSIIVSVVVPSLNRHKIVTKAVHSALTQTLKLIEVIVVVDGPDEVTVEELQKINDSRLKIKTLPVNLGCSHARNIGVDEAQGEWIAFLDDDDLWYPNKLELQLVAAQKSSCKFPFIASRCMSKTPTNEFVLPKKLPNPRENMSEFLFVRESLFERAELIQTSTFFTSKKLLQKVPFTENLRIHEDWEWLIRINDLDDVEIEVLPDVLAIRFCDEARESLSNVRNWQFSREWIRSIKNLITPQAYAGFLLRVSTRQASMNQKWQAFLPLLWEALKDGKPRAKDILSFFLVWLMPIKLRQKLRSLVSKHIQII
jgi:glycosyltransferase involved in cell wall biosynthesis